MGPEFVVASSWGALLEEPKVSEILGCLSHWRAQEVDAATTCKQVSLAVGGQGLAGSLCEFRAHGWLWALRQGGGIQLQCLVIKASLRRATDVKYFSPHLHLASLLM